jgi:hypothetical protein
VSAKNGGKVTYEDRSSFTQPYAQKHYFLNGVATNEELELHFDVFPPVHCFEQHNDCQQDALNVTDFLTQVTSIIKCMIHFYKIIITQFNENFILSSSRFNF